MSQPREPEEPTRNLGRAFAVAARIQALPPHLHAAALRSACGDDQELAQQVQAILHSGNAAPPPTSSTAPTSGSSFGRYQLHERLGEGSMGVVFRATQLETGRLVALKRLRQGEASESLLRCFHREIALLARLQHPGIVQILDAGHVLGEAGREPFLAMELVEGEPLLTAVDRLGLDLRAKVGVLVQLCRAIAYAHRRGVIHRDVKPDNVLLEVDGERGLRTRILDFGVATAHRRGHPDGTLDRHLVGTLGYLAPEQIDGEVDVRSDLYGLGAIGYRLLTGHPPLDLRELGLLAALAKIRDTDPPPASRHAPPLRGDLDAVLQKALARDPELRYASADQFADDLERWLACRPVAARPPTALYLLSRFVRRQRTLAALAGALLASLLVGGYVTLHLYGAASAANRHLVSTLSATLAELSTSTLGRPPAQSLPEHLRVAVRDLVAADPEDQSSRVVQAEFLEIEGNLARRAGQLRRALELRGDLLDVARWLAAHTAAHGERRRLAKALVLVGDMHKEIAQPHQGSFAAARACYEEAHTLYAAAAAAEPTARHTRDDLAHSFLRLGAIDLRDHDLAAAASRFAAASRLVHGLLADFPDHTHTHGLMRELLGLTNELAAVQGSRAPAVATLEAMMVHTLAMHRLAPDDLHAAEFLLATARSCADASFQSGDLQRARHYLATAEPMAQYFAERDPGNVQALTERTQVAILQMRFANAGRDPAEAFRHAAHSLRLALAMREADDHTSLHEIVSRIVGQLREALRSLDVLTAEQRLLAAEPANRILPQLATVAALFAKDRDLRVALVELLAEVGDAEQCLQAEATLQLARGEGWFDERLWLLTSVLRARRGDLAGARANLDRPPAGLSPDLQLSAERLRRRLDE